MNIRAHKQISRDEHSRRDKGRGSRSRDVKRLLARVRHLSPRTSTSGSSPSSKMGPCLSRKAWKVFPLERECTSGPSKSITCPSLPNTILFACTYTPPRAPPQRPAPAPLAACALTGGGNSTPLIRRNRSTTSATPAEAMTTGTPAAWHSRKSSRQPGRGFVLAASTASSSCSRVSRPRFIRSLAAFHHQSCTATCFSSVIVDNPRNRRSVWSQRSSTSFFHAGPP
mmetsp:Transcript_61636/g.165598  ORF Transcript_61636/g.165598 Transcript_61636/m.165598 type:complete len:226 (-) Transcript_61636:293-970(-)